MTAQAIERAALLLSTGNLSTAEQMQLALTLWRSAIETGRMERALDEIVAQAQDEDHLMRTSPVVVQFPRPRPEVVR